jgi:hypothetical protein
MPNIDPMSPAHQPEVEHVTEEISGRQLWDAAVGRVFKVSSKQRGLRMVTYTLVKAVRDAEPAGSGTFEIEVLCIEIAARSLASKRMHSNICKEGVLQQEADTDLLPESFGTECTGAEFERISGAILAYTNSYLDWSMQAHPEERTDIEVGIDLPHLKLTDMEASFVRNSPFLVRDLYFLTPNSIAAAQASIQQELQRALRGMLLTDEVDATYVQRKNDALVSLQAKFKAAQDEEAEAQRILATVTEQQEKQRDRLTNLTADRRRPGFAALQLDSLTLAMLGKPSATTVRWIAANPSEEGPISCLGSDYSPLDFVRWAHVSGATVPPAEGAARKLKDYFKGFNQAYTGPDHEGIYPLLKPATE